MDSLEVFYKKNLQGKSAKEIRGIIRKLKNEIGSLKNKIIQDSFDFIDSEPSLYDQLSYNRMYLKRTIQALEDLGIEYKLSKTEQKVKTFNDNIKYISKIELETGGYLADSSSYTITIDGDEIIYEEIQSIFPGYMSTEKQMTYPLTKNELFEEIKKLYIGEWNYHYENNMILDGDYWSLIIEFSNGYQTRKFTGSNAYPYNFYQLERLIEIDDNY